MDSGTQRSCTSSPGPLLLAGSTTTTTDRLGHGDIRVTMNTYGHLFPGFDGDIADALGAAFGAV